MSESLQGGGGGGGGRGGEVGGGGRARGGGGGGACGEVMKVKIKEGPNMKVTRRQDLVT